MAQLELGLRLISSSRIVDGLILFKLLGLRVVENGKPAV